MGFDLSAIQSCSYDLNTGEFTGTRYILDHVNVKKNGEGEDVGRRDRTRLLWQMDSRLPRGQAKEFRRVETRSAIGV